MKTIWGNTVVQKKSWSKLPKQPQPAQISKSVSKNELTYRTWLKRLCIQATAAVFLVASIAFHGRVSRCITKSRGKQLSVGKTTDNER